MKKGKFERATPAAPVRRRRRNSGAKLGLLILAITMLVGSTLGGTLAYLTDQTASVKNTFTVGDVGDLTLTETPVDKYVVVPGVDITKDPTVTYEGNNIDAYIFVKIDGGNKWKHSHQPLPNNYSTNTYSVVTGNAVDLSMYFNVADGWGKLNTSEDVYWRKVTATATAAAENGKLSFPIIENDTVYVSSAITEATIANYASELTFTAYAIQAAGFEDDVAGAWGALNNQ